MIMEILVFGKETCAKCRTTKHKISHLLGNLKLSDTIPLRYYDIETVDGMVEGAWRDVLNVPTVVIDSNSSELARWSGEVPGSDEMKNILLGQNAPAPAESEAAPAAGNT